MQSATRAHSNGIQGDAAVAAAVNACRELGRPRRYVRGFDCTISLGSNDERRFIRAMV